MSTHVGVSVNSPNVTATPGPVPKVSSSMAGAQGPQGPAGPGWDPSAYAKINPNLLSAAASGFEDGSTGGWAATNATLANTTAQAHTGTRSLQTTGPGTGTNVTVTQVIPIDPALIGRPVNLSAWLLPGSAIRTVRMQVDWRTAAGALIGSTVTGPNVTEQAGQWVLAYLSSIPPANTGQATVYVWIGSATVAGEVHYIDDVVVTAVTPASLRMEWTVAGTYTVTVPPWATQADIYAIGGGGGGGGGGSATSVNQAGGAGGGQAVPSRQTVPAVGGQTWTALVGAGGTAGTAGTAGGNAGGLAGVGGLSRVYTGTTLFAFSPGGGNGQGSVANSTTTVYGGAPGGAGTVAGAAPANQITNPFSLSASATTLRGYGGYGGASAQLAMWNADAGGGAGGGPGSTSTGLGGYGGNAFVTGALPPVSVWNSAAATDANGLAGQTATLPGCGGGGGGGGAPGGNGGAGGAGAPGRVVIVFRP